MAAVAFAEISIPRLSRDDRQELELVHCAERAFTFTELDAGEELDRSFEAWAGRGSGGCVANPGNGRYLDFLTQPVLTSPAQTTARY